MSLDAQLIQAHESRDRAALIVLYQKAAEQAADEDAACYFLTQAYVFALEQGDPRSRALKDLLREKGRI